MMTDHGSVLFGTVTATKDELGLGRVEVLLDDHGVEIRVWARVLQSASGAFVLPEIDDPVIVLRGPGGVAGWVVLGSLYTGKRRPTSPDNDGKNNLKQIRTRSGNEITLDDTDNAEQIRIRTDRGEVGIVLEKKGAKLTIRGKTEVLVASDHKVVVQSKTVEVTGQSSVALRSTSGPVTIESQGDLEVKSAGSVKVSGTAVEIG